MIILDEHAVGQRTAMICSPAQGNRPFLKRPPPGKSFAGIENLDPAALSCWAESAGQGGDPREVLQEIQSDPLGRKDLTGVSFHSQKRVPVPRARAVLLEHRQDQ